MEENKKKIMMETNNMKMEVMEMMLMEVLTLCCSL